MKIVDYMLAKIAPRLRQKRLLVIYDPAGRFKSLAETLAKSQQAQFLNATTHLLDALKSTHLGIQAGLKQAIVVYLPHPAPQTIEAKVVDPFAAFAEIGARFPASPADEYEQLCLQALPQKEAAVRELFAHCDSLKGPDFELVEPLFEDTSTKWTMLRGLSGKKSESELLQWLLPANDRTYLSAAAEIRPFALQFLGVSLTESDFQNISVAQEKLWMAALMTEFMAVRTEEAPAEFASVAVAPLASRNLVLDTVQNLRNNRETQAIYEKFARQIATKLDVASHLNSISVDKTRCTFVEESQRIKQQILVALTKGQFSDVEQLVDCLSKSIWQKNNDVFLRFVKSSVAFWQKLSRLENELNDPPSQIRIKETIDSYCRIGADVDGLARRFVSQADELRAQDTEELHEEKLGTLSSHLLSTYRSLKEREHSRFINAIVEDGWPSGAENNASVFATNVAPLLSQGARVVLIVVDALRYEMALSLTRSLQNFAPKLKPACATLPTITSVGKASLLPGGESLSLEVEYKTNSITPKIGDMSIQSVDDRMKILRGQFGDRFKQMSTKEFLPKKPSEFAKTEFLCLRYDDIDETLEAETGSMFDAISRGVQHLNQIVRRIAAIGKFTDVVIVTDHGFGLNLQVGAGDKCEKPEGNWVSTHERFLLGEGHSDAANIVVPSEHLGIKSNARYAAFPRALCTYQAGRQYFHGGVSLAETVVPVIALRFSQNSGKETNTSDQLLLGLVPRKQKFTTLIVRLTLKILSKPLQLEKELTEHPVQIVITKKGSKEQAGIVLDNDAGVLTVIDGDIDFRVKLNRFDEQSRTIQVTALDQQTGKRLAETSFEVEIMQ